MLRHKQSQHAPKMDEDDDNEADMRELTRAKTDMFGQVLEDSIDGEEEEEEDSGEDDASDDDGDDRSIWELFKEKAISSLETYDDDDLKQKVMDLIIQYYTTSIHLYNLLEDDKTHDKIMTTKARLMELR